jgi:uncharacterized protein
MIIIFLISLCTGAVAGILAGLFGLGGGIIIVPALVWLFSWAEFASDQIMIMAVATSLATILPTGLSSVYAHHKMQSVLWAKVWLLVPGVIVGAAGGAWLAHSISPAHLRWLFIIYLLYVSVSMALQFKPVIKLPQQSWPDYAAGLVIGSLSSLLGIGGGTMTVPYLLSRKLAIKNAVAISSACGLPIAIAASISYIVVGFDQENLPLYSLGYIYTPAFLGIVCSSIVTAPIGANLAHRLPAAQLKRYFSVILLLVAIKMIF